MKKILFVALSHTLTQEQIADFDGEIVLLSTVSPELAQECSNIDPKAPISHIQHLAAQVVVLAVLAESTHFCCQGEVGLAMWANLIASGNVTFQDDSYPKCFFIGTHTRMNNGGWINISELEDTLHPQMQCITSTTERKSIDELQPDGSVIKRAVFKHVMWRELF